jgi:lipoyl(octanoyl) transferase
VPGRLLVTPLARLPYQEALELQRAAARARISGALGSDLLLLVEHPRVVTLGRSTRAGNLLVQREALAEMGIEVADVERGGDVTYHGPGQLVGYPVFDLRQHRTDLHWYLRQLEEVLIRTLATFGLAAGRRAGYTGVWVGEQGASAPAALGAAGGPSGARTAPGGAGPGGEPGPPAGPARGVGPALTGDGPATLPAGRKIGSIGVHAREWVTWHGFALNVSTDLSAFDLMVPCGIAGVRMTSIAREAGIGPPLEVAAERVVSAVRSAFGFEVVEPVSLAELSSHVATAVPGGTAREPSGVD